MTRLLVLGPSRTISAQLAHLQTLGLVRSGPPINSQRKEAAHPNHAIPKLTFLEARRAAPTAAVPKGGSL